MTDWELRSIPTIWKVIGVGLLMFVVGMILLAAGVGPDVAEKLAMTGGVIMMISAVYLAFYRK